MLSKISLVLLALMTIGQVCFAQQAGQKSYYDCARNPKFIQTSGMAQPVAIDTIQSRFPGVVVKELRGAKRIYRHPSWEVSGHVGSTVRDELGHIYVIPVPSIGLDTNPMANRNTVFIIDSVGAEMTKFIELPTEKNTSQTNPFGTMGLAFDCQSRSLYVSSVANSRADTINGTIYQIDVDTADIVSRLEGIDGIGLAVFDAGHGKRLYFGDARSSSMYSVPLADNGNLQLLDKPKHELSLLSIKNGNSTQIKRIQFVADKHHGYKLIVTETEFAFRLLAQSGRRFKHYEFILDSRAENWQIVQIR